MVYCVHAVISLCSKQTADYAWIVSTDKEFIDHQLINWTRHPLFVLLCYITTCILYMYTLELHRTHTLWALSTVSGLCCISYRQFNTTCSRHCHHVGVCFSCVSMEPGQWTCQPLNWAGFYHSVLNDFSETPGDNYMNRNIGNSALCMTQ